MRDAAFAAAGTADAVIMAAAVADFRPASNSDTKIKSAGFWKRADAGSIPLVRNPDILAQLGAARVDDPAAGPAVLVGFAAETGDPVAEARRKLRAKQCDLVVGNQVGRGGSSASTKPKQCLSSAGLETPRRSAAGSPNRSARSRRPSATLSPAASHPARSGRGERNLRPPLDLH